MLLTLLFVGAFCTVLYLTLAIVVVHVVLRREGAYIIEKRIQAVVDAGKSLEQLQPVHMRTEHDLLPGASSSKQLSLDHDAVVSPTVTAGEIIPRSRTPQWLKNADYNGIVIHQQHLEIRSIHRLRNNNEDAVLVGHIPIDKCFLSDAAEAAGLSTVDMHLRRVSEYRATEGLLGEIFANFVPCSGRPIPVIVTAQDWNTGERSDFLICRVRLDYNHTFRALGRMGLRRAAWLMPLLILVVSLALLYSAGLVICVRFARHLVDSIDMLSRAAGKIGEGDLSARVPALGDDQLGDLAASFNEMAGHLSSLREKEKEQTILEADLRLASEVQTYLTPTKPGAFTGGTVWSTSTPARHVSGDLHDLFYLDGHRIGLLCADISGKGISSALVMAHLQGVIHAHLSTPCRRVSPAELARIVNRYLFGRSELSRYATLLYAEVDLLTRKLRYVNAGHCPPLLLHAGQETLLTEGDLPVGMFADAEYADHEIVMPEDSKLIIYTDGVTEALNEAGEQYGYERLRAAASRASTLPNAVDIGRFLEEEVSTWSQGANFDDATFVILSLAGDIKIAPGAIGEKSSGG
jgi:serine phosphatase RsbU (regulator of sigma subunit)